MPIHVFSNWPNSGFPNPRVWPGTQDPSPNAQNGGTATHLSPFWIFGLFSTQVNVLLCKTETISVLPRDNCCVAQREKGGRPAGGGRAGGRANSDPTGVHPPTQDCYPPAGGDEVTETNATCVKCLYCMQLDDIIKQLTVRPHQERRHTFSRVPLRLSWMGPLGPHHPCVSLGCLYWAWNSQKSDFWGGFPRRERRMTRNRAWKSQKSDFWGGFPRRERRMTSNRAWKSQKSDFWGGFPRRERRMTSNRAWKTTPTPLDAKKVHPATFPGLA